MTASTLLCIQQTLGLFNSRKLKFMTLSGIILLMYMYLVRKRITALNGEVRREFTVSQLNRVRRMKSWIDKINTANSTSMSSLHICK